MKRPKLVVVEQGKFQCTTTSNLPVDDELQSVEETLKLLNAALKAHETGALDKTEILRFRTP